MLLSSSFVLAIFVVVVVVVLVVVECGNEMQNKDEFENRTGKCENVLLRPKNLEEKTAVYSYIKFTRFIKIKVSS